MSVTSRDRITDWMDHVHTVWNLLCPYASYLFQSYLHPSSVSLTPRILFNFTQTYSCFDKVNYIYVKKITKLLNGDQTMTDNDRYR